MGLGGVEPPTSRLSGARSSQLSYRPRFDQAQDNPSDRTERRGKAQACCDKPEQLSKISKTDEAESLSLKVEGIEPVEITCSLRRLSLPFQRLSISFLSNFRLRASKALSPSKPNSKSRPIAEADLVDCSALLGPWDGREISLTPYRVSLERR